MLLCLECYKIYNQKTIKNNMCKIKGCDGDVVEVDELFAPVIAELNRKGYRTKFCCSGHYTEDYPNTYINFEEGIKLPSLPEGYKYDKEIYPDVNWEKWKMEKYVTIRNVFDKGKSVVELSLDIFNSAVSVLEWAEGLEEFVESRDED